MIASVEEKLIVGIRTLTHNQNENNPQTAQIKPLIERFWKENIIQKIPHQKNPETIYILYTEYQSDFNGPYTCLIGIEVSQIEELPEGLTSIFVPLGNYKKFTAGPGPIPLTVIQTWGKIWTATEQELGGPRTYQVDFEVYDERAKDLNHATVDIYIGVNTEKQD